MTWREDGAGLSCDEASGEQVGHVAAELSGESEGPSVPVRETADGPHGPSNRHGRPSAICPWMPQHHAMQRYTATHPGAQTERPASAPTRS
jgi:hypothetical protein